MTQSNSLKDKAYLLYNNLKENRTSLISYYNSNGTIRFDIATGLAYIDSNGNIQERSKYIKQFDEFGNLIVDNDGKIIYKKILDFEEIKKINQNDGIVSGTMADALIKRATGKVVELYSNDQCLRWGMISLGTTECLLKIKEDINLIPYDIMPLYNVYGDNIYKIDSENESSYGLVHSLPEKIERYSYFLRGQFKAYNYRGDAEILNNPISLWSYADKTTLSTSLFGLNSLIRMFGNNQIIDLEGHEISISECTNIFSPLASLINLSDGAFDSLSTRGCKNSYIYSSVNFGRLGRSNHFGILGNLCENILIENIHVGDDTTKNIGTYFGSILFNVSSNIVVKDVKQEHLNTNIVRSALGLIWRSDLTMNELLLGKLIRVQDWDIYSNYYKWLKWENISEGEEDKYLNGKQTVYPIIKSIDELEQEIGLEGAIAVFEGLRAAQETYRISTKNIDDVSIQVDVLRGQNFEPLTNNKVITDEQVARTTNLTAANALNKDEMNMYAESSAYGFRAGSKDRGTGNLAKTKIDDAMHDIYLINFEFSTASASLEETVSIVKNDRIYRAFNDMGLRPFGYSNSRNPSSGMATATMLISPSYIAKTYGFSEAVNLSPGSNPYTILSGTITESKYAFDTAFFAYKNCSQEIKDSWGNSENIHGIYKGNDVLENSLCTITAIGYLYKYFPESKIILDGINNSILDIGILAWRKSIMNEIGALSANHVGLNGGFKGDISDYNPGQSTENTSNQGEIYPWYVSKETTNYLTYNIETISIDKKYTSIKFINEFHNLYVGNNVLLLAGSEEIYRTVLKVVSSTKIVVNSLHHNNYKKLIHYVGTRLDGTKTPKIIIDKDSDYFNATDIITHDRSTVKVPYLATSLPKASSNIFKFKLRPVSELYPEQGTIMYLVRVNTNPNDIIEEKVTYKHCADLLGFDYIGNNIISDLNEYVEYTLCENLDTQNHTHKGVMGIRLDQIKDSAIIDCNVNKIENTAFFPEVRLIGNKDYLYTLDVLQERRPGSHINDSYGISINGCENNYIENFSVSDNKCLGNNYGIQINGESANVDINGATITNLESGLIYTNADSYNLSNRTYYYSTFSEQDAIGVNIKKGCTNVILNNISGSGINSPSKDLSELIRYSIE